MLNTLLGRSLRYPGRHKGILRDTDRVVGSEGRFSRAEWRNSLKEVGDTAVRGSNACKDTERYLYYFSQVVEKQHEF